MGTIKIRLDLNALEPGRAYTTDAGIDLKSPYDIFLPAQGSVSINTGVHVQIPEGYCGLLVSKSGLNVKSDISSTGLIDSGYTGAIVVKLYNHGCHGHFIKRGDKISQMVILPCLIRDIEIVKQITGGERGDNGFGSSGR